MISKRTIIESLRDTPNVVVDLVHSADPMRMKERPKSGAWSIHEHACHLADVQPLMMSRLDFILSNDSPHIQGYQPDSDEDPDRLLGLDLEVSLKQFVEERARMIERLHALNESDWNKQATHDEYVKYSVAIMFRHLAMHDYLHAYRIEQLIIENDP